MPPYLADPAHPHHEQWLTDPDGAAEAWHAALAEADDSAVEQVPPPKPAKKKAAPAKAAAKKARK